MQPVTQLRGISEEMDPPDVPTLMSSSPDSLFSTFSGGSAVTSEVRRASVVREI